jgi:cation diffusion facilitator family transporter
VSDAAETKRTVHWAIAANLAITVAKVTAGALSGSAALLAEAAHSSADTGNQLLLRISLSRAERPPDDEHPFGFGRERFFWALLVAVLMFVLGAIFSVGEGVLAFFVELGHDRFPLLYGVLAVALVAESISLARVLRELRGSAAEAELSLREYLRASTDPTTKTVLFEDAAGVAGVLVAAAGIAAHQATGMRAWEGGASIVIGLGLAVVAFELGSISKALLIGQPARPEELARIRGAVNAYPEVGEIVDLRTVHSGPHDLVVAMRLDFRDGITSEVIEDVSARIERDLRAIVPDVAEVYLDATRVRSADTARR